MSDATTLWLREDETVADHRPRPEQPRGLPWPQRLLLDTVYVLSAFPIAWAMFVVVVTGLALAAGLSVVVGGVLLLPVVVYAARSEAFFERLRLRGMLRRPARTPTYATARPGDGFWRRAMRPVRDPQSWLDVTWALVSPVTATFGFVVAVTWWAGALGGTTYWFWQRFIPREGNDRGLAYFLGLGNSRAAESLVELVLGLVLLVTLPWVLRGVAVLHGGLATSLLCSRAELQAEVARVESSREAAREAEATSLRRLERDIHDGPQQRLVRLSMDLGRARHRLDSDPDGAAEIIDGALAQARETVEELRALSKGVAPPLLVDRGLRAAIEEMVAQSPVPVDCRLDLPATLPPHVETTAYFFVAEALTNVAKHSGARSATVHVWHDERSLQVSVTDDGVGGAHLAKGLGIAGLRQRLEAADGTLRLDSPSGGPTTLAATIPLRFGDRADA